MALSPIFSEDKKPVLLSGRALSLRLGHSENTLKKIKRPLKGMLLEIFNPKRRQRHAKVNFGDDRKRETSNR